MKKSKELPKTVIIDQDMQRLLDWQRVNLKYFSIIPFLLLSSWLSVRALRVVSDLEMPPWLGDLSILAIAIGWLTLATFVINSQSAAKKAWQRVYERTFPGSSAVNLIYEKLPRVDWKYGRAAQYAYSLIFFIVVCMINKTWQPTFPFWLIATIVVTIIVKSFYSLFHELFEVEDLLKNGTLVYYQRIYFPPGVEKYYRGPGCPSTSQANDAEPTNSTADADDNLTADANRQKSMMSSLTGDNWYMMTNQAATSEHDGTTTFCGPCVQVLATGRGRKHLEKLVKLGVELDTHEPGTWHEVRLHLETLSAGVIMLTFRDKAVERKEAAKVRKKIIDILEQV